MLSVEHIFSSGTRISRSVEYHTTMMSDDQLTEDMKKKILQVSLNTLLVFFTLVESFKASAKRSWNILISHRFDMTTSSYKLAILCHYMHCTQLHTRPKLRKIKLSPVHSFRDKDLDGHTWGNLTVITNNRYASQIHRTK